jgi:hypothetical protein
MKALLLNFFITSILYFVILCACDATRHNPLDPSNPNNKLSVLSGSVFTRNAPPSPISQANVFWRPAGRIIQTNSKGDFFFDDLVTADGWLIVSKNGFSPDSIHIVISEKEQKSQEFFLNSEPVLVAANMSSEVQNRYPATQATKVEINVKVNDTDNDIDSVFISNDVLGIYKVLDYNAGKRQFEQNFSPYQLGVINLEQVVGQNFEITVKDLTGAVFSIGSTQLKRIIHQEIQFDTPSNSQQVTGSLELAWDLFNPGFNFFYNVEIFTDEFFYQELVWEKTHISSEYSSIMIEPDLPDGNYFWVIWCVDEYGNRSRSKPATFTISGS